jgi:tetratricopeptide (TPR) repeat protein
LRSGKQQTGNPTLPPIRFGRPLNAFQKLIRLAAIGLTMLIGYKGVHPSPRPVKQLAIRDAEIAASDQNPDLLKLTKSLLDRNPSWVGANAPQMVAEAVQSIAQGASEGDKRLQQALNLLNDNNVAEATQILTVAAEDKCTRAEQAATQTEKDHKEAAIAYRNLGAIAGLRDPKRALEAYEKAASLDPGDVGSLFWAGRIEIDHGDLDEAQTPLERVLELAETDDQTHYKYWAYIGLGGIWRKRGDLKAALKSYSDSLAIAKRVARSDPGNPNWQREVSVSYNKVGEVQVAQGDLKAAVKSYTEALTLRERLAKSNPGNADWQRDLWFSYAIVADAYRNSNEIAKARDALAAGRAVIGKLVEHYPDQARWQQDLAWFDAQIAELGKTPSKENPARK